MKFFWVQLVINLILTACIIDCCCCLVYGEDLYRLLPAIQSISLIYE